MHSWKLEKWGRTYRLAALLHPQITTDQSSEPRQHPPAQSTNRGRSLAAPMTRSLHLSDTSSQQHRLPARAAKTHTCPSVGCTCG